MVVFTTVKGASTLRGSMHSKLDTHYEYVRLVAASRAFHSLTRPDLTPFSQCQVTKPSSHFNSFGQNPQKLTIF